MNEGKELWRIHINIMLSRKEAELVIQLLTNLKERDKNIIGYKVETQEYYERTVRRKKELESVKGN
jgi:hypothetical protein